LFKCIDFNHDDRVMKELIIKYIVGEADNQERLLVEAWVAEHNDNRKELEEMKKVWDIGKEPINIPEIDVDKAWSDFVRLRDGRKRHNLNWISVAASLLLLGAFAFWGLQSTLSIEKKLKTDLQVQH